VFNLHYVTASTEATARAQHATPTEHQGW